MSGRFHILFLLFLIRFSAIVFPQHPEEAVNNAEELLYRNETAEIPEEIFEEHMNRINHPVNLNTATPEQLGESGLFTPFQIHVLIEYRNEFGNLYSIYELASLTGFRVSRIRKIACYLTVETGSIIRPEHPGNGMVLINAGRVFPESVGYNTTGGVRNKPAYDASPLKISIRIKAHAGRNLSLGLAYEKDAGEKSFHGIQPEFISGYVIYRGYRIIKQIVAGNFQLHHGLGLVNGVGFMHSPEGFQLNRNSISKLKPYASLNEYRFHRGAACRMDLKQVELMIWSSYRKLDLSLNDLPENMKGIDWMDHQRKTGLHRLSGELEGRSLGFRLTSGIQAVTRIKNLALGSMYGFEVCSLTSRGIDSLKADIDPSMHHSCSFQWQWSIRQFESFGELAAGNWNSAAILTGYRYHFNDFFKALLLLHHYGPAYRGFLSSSYASGSTIGNEKGIALQLLAEPGKSFIVDFTAELFSYPASRYLTSVPSRGYRYSCTFRNTGYGSLQWKIRLVKKLWQTTPGTDNPGIRSIRTSEVTRLDLRIIYNPGFILQWQSRVVISLLSGSIKPVPGYAAVQQAGISAMKKLKCTLQFVVFNVADWDNRIYLYEPGLYYSFNFPVYYGKGQKVSFVLSLKPGRKVTIAYKTSFITYHDRENTGSGNDMIPGNKKWETGLQVRFSL